MSGHSDIVLVVSAFVAVAGVILMLGVALLGRRSEAEARIEKLGLGRRTAPGAALSAQTAGPLPRWGKNLLPKNEAKLADLKNQLVKAGLYQRHSGPMFAFIRFTLMAAPMVAGLGLSAVGAVGYQTGLLWGATISLLGNFLPVLWLKQLKASRAKQIRRALPDALDVIVICMEGGMSLPSALAKVASELRSAHPLLASEMAIVQREVQLGRTTGEALAQFSDRFNVDELRSLSSVINQAERFGASLVKALRVHSDSLRLKRFQYAEAQAQKAPVKLIFPTVLCIFPALYVVLMGPAGVHLWKLLEQL